jgi:hypothetical protein
MNKRLIFLITLISILGLAFASAAAPAKTARLLDIQFIQGKGLVINFKVTGKFSPSDLKGSLYVYGEKSFPLDCAFKDNQDNTRLACVGSDGLRDYAGKGALVQFADLGFYVNIPSPEYFCTFGEATKVLFRVTLADGTVVEILTGVTGEMGKNYHDFETFAKQLIRDWFGYDNVTDIDFIFLGCEQQ